MSGLRSVDSYLANVGPAQVEQDELTIGRVHGVMLAGESAVRFRVMNPDSRMRLKISVMYVSDGNGAEDITAMATTLYLGEEEQSRKAGRRIICTDILRDSLGNVVHQSAPLTIPEDAGLEGFTAEFVTAADSILGIFSTESPGGFDGHWVVKARWQPDGQRLCDSDWEYQSRKCRIGLLTDEFDGGE